MGDRGRKSGAELLVVGGKGIAATARPKPPPGLTHEQAVEWREIVNHMAADHFQREHWPMLEAYCQHTIALRHIRQLITAAESPEEIDIKEYDRLLKMQERESRCIASLAVRLGIAQTTAYDGKKKPQTAKNPWDFGKVPGVQKEGS